MKICPKCQNINADSAMFCSKCGAKLTASKPYSSPNNHANNRSHDYSHQNCTGQNSQPASNGKGLKILYSILLMLGAIVCGFITLEAEITWLNAVLIPGFVVGLRNIWK